MKKIVIVMAITLFGLGVNAQSGFKTGVHLGLPMGDSGDFSTFSLGLDALYMFEASDAFDVGLATGFTHAFGKEIGSGANTIEVDDIQFLPIAAAGRFNATEDLSIGVDLGYALGINDGNDGGFYYRPIVGYNVGETVELTASYTGISLDGFNWSTINLGVLFHL